VITIKEEFLGSDKTRRAIQLGGSDAVLMWLALKTFCATNLTDGFVSSEDVDLLPVAPKNRRRAMSALVECGRLNADGTRGHGLLDVVPNGFQLHDYLDHAQSRVEELHRKDLARKRQKDHRDKKRQRDMASVTPDPVTRDMVRDDSCDNRVDNGPHARARARPQPNPTQPNPAGGDLSPTGPKPTNLDEAILVPLTQRAQALKAEPYSAEWIQPQRWPETLEVVGRLHELAGLAPPKLGSYQADSAVRSAVELFAAGVTVEEILAALPQVVASDWWRQKRRDFGAVTPTVIRRAAPTSGPVVDPEEAEREKRRAYARKRNEELDRRAREAS
jgi:hypothetical protein